VLEILLQGGAAARTFLTREPHQKSFLFEAPPFLRSSPLISF
jgi:hypothetical protein